LTWIKAPPRSSWYERIMEKKRERQLYWFWATIAIVMMALMPQAVLSQPSRVETIPYGEFQQLAA
jgi:hypothetical protein